MNKPERYLGDGVYAVYDRGHIWLDCRGQGGPGRSPDGRVAIAIAGEVLEALNDFAEDLRSRPAVDVAPCHVCHGEGLLDAGGDSVVDCPICDGKGELPTIGGAG